MTVLQSPKALKAGAVLILWHKCLCRLFYSHDNMMASPLGENHYFLTCLH